MRLSDLMSTGLSSASISTMIKMEGSSLAGLFDVLALGAYPLYVLQPVRVMGYRMLLLCTLLFIK